MALVACFFKPFCSHGKILWHPQAPCVIGAQGILCIHPALFGKLFKQFCSLLIILFHAGTVGITAGQVV